MENIEGYEKLAADIVLQAVNDFRTAAKEYKKGKHTEENLKVMKEVIDFIKSDWYKVLTDIDPDKVIKKLKERLNATSNRVICRRGCSA